MGDLGYLNMFAHDIQRMASFYADLFQLEEIRESRSRSFEACGPARPILVSMLMTPTRFSICRTLRAAPA
jgi:hypothetical protein